MTRIALAATRAFFTALGVAIILFVLDTASNGGVFNKCEAMQ